MKYGGLEKGKGNYTIFYSVGVKGVAVVLRNDIVKHVKKVEC